MTDQPRADAMLCGIHAEYNPTCHMCTADQPRADPIADPFAMLHDNGFTWDDVNALAAILDHYGLTIAAATGGNVAAPADPTADLRAALQRILSITEECAGSLPTLDRIEVERLARAALAASTTEDEA